MIILDAGVALSTILAAVLTFFVWQERPKTGATAMATAAYALVLWGGGQLLVLTAAVSWVATAGLTVTYLGQALVPAAWYVFGQQYTGRREAIPRRTLVLLAAGPVLVVALGSTNSVHELFWVDPAFVTRAGETTFTYEYGVGTVVHVAYAYLLVAVGTRYLLEKFLASRNVYRTRTFLFIFIAVTVVAASALSYLGVSPLPYLTLTPVVFLGLAIIALLSVSSNQFVATVPLERIFGLFSQRSKSLAPVARDTAIEELGSGFLVTDHKNRVVDINPMGKRILGRESERVVGQQLKRVLPPEVFVTDETEFLDSDVTGEYTALWVTTDGERRCFDVTINGLATDDGDINGRVGLVHDVTRRERRKQTLEERTDELERQNEQLENFAGIVSHDLRNPLNVANGRLELIDTKVDTAEEDIQGAKDALARMEGIIDDVLTLARLGRTISDTEPLSIETIAEDAWENVETPAATLDLDVSLTVEGSDSRLLQVFENLFRNAIEHGREDVTITVGQFRDGFYIEDDGPGIPEQHHEDVLEEGFTTSEDGTGFGLSIIRTIIEAHGWDITVTTAPGTGGARFEVTDVATKPGQEVHISD